MRLIAIGDIHGEIEKLNNLIKKLKIKSDDTIIFLGDYIDRGLYSKQVVDKLIELSSYCNCEFLMGNHEYDLLKMLKGDIYAKHFFFEDGGRQTIDSYGSIENIVKVHGDFFNNLKTYYLTDKYLFVHAGIRPDINLEEQDLFDMLVIRDNFINYKHKLKQKVVFGHTPFKKPYIEDDKVVIDTGCGKYLDSPLTAFICNEEKFISAI